MHMNPILIDGDRVPLLYWIDRDLGLDHLAQTAYPREDEKAEFLKKYERLILEDFMDTAMSKTLTVDEVMNMSNQELMGR